ncbi:MAG: sulfotransferase family protein [Hyphomonadaceae bacterium]|nr:sulfotransferase family protein [Hyphomonadaceae bacterium]
MDPPLTPHSGGRSSLNKLFHGLEVITSDAKANAQLLGTLDIPLAAQHLTYMEIRLLGLIPPKELETCYKFAVARNPFERVFSSLFHFKYRFSAFENLSANSSALEFERAISFWLEVFELDHNLLAHRRPQSEYVLDFDNQIAVDRVLRFEYLEQDFEGLRCDLKLPPGALPRVGRRAPRIDYANVISSKSAYEIRRAFERDFDLFEYDTSPNGS